MRPAPVVALFVLVASSLAHADGNQPPIASGHADATDVVLGQRVTFISTSTDPDGVIVETAWEFSDGRAVRGAEVTTVFQYPGVHEVRLAVRDDAGAWGNAAFFVLVRAPVLSGRAVALALGDSAYADTGEVRKEYQENETRAALGEVARGGLRAAALDASVVTYTTPERVVARANVGLVHIPHPLGFFHVTGVEAEARVECATPAVLFSDVAKLRLNDAPIVPPGQVPPNTRVDLPGGVTLVLNEQEGTGAGPARVVALRVLVDGESVAELGRAEAGIAYCPVA